MAENGSKKAVSSAPPAKPKRVRSPNYPGLNLEAAIKRAEEFYGVEKRNAANVGIAVGHWGFNATSSGGIITLAALKAFGLIEDEGSGKERKIKISSLGFKIILDKRTESSERDAAIKEAALHPAIHAKLWRLWKNELPSDENFRHVLENDHHFNEKSVQLFMQEYKDTITYANLQNSDSITGQENDINGPEKTTEEETQTMPEVQTPAGKTPLVPPPISAGPSGSKPVGASIPVTRDCSMTVMASGPVTQKGIDQLMAYLKLVRDSFPEN